MTGVKTLRPALPRGFRCSRCGKWHNFTVWVFDHWDLPIWHECDICGTFHDICRGVPTTRKV